MTFEVMYYGHLWTKASKTLPFVQYAICIMLNVERLVAIILKLRYLHQYHNFSREERTTKLFRQFVAKIILNGLVIAFWFYDVIA
jgi:hypothetical protein